MRGFEDEGLKERLGGCGWEKKRVEQELQAAESMLWRRGCRSTMLVALEDLCGEED